MIRTVLAGGLLAMAGAAFGACPPVFQSSGNATLYTPGTLLACSVPVYPLDTMVTALAGAQWDGSAHCGECLEVTGPLGTVTVRVVDRCIGCSAGGLDMHPDAFAQIAPVASGSAAVTWRRVDCPVDGNVLVRIRESANPYYLPFTPDQHRQAIAGIAAMTGSGWEDLPRAEDNTFVLTGGGPYEPPLPLRVVSTSGEVIEQAATSLAAGSVLDLGRQFSACIEDAIFIDGFEPSAG